MIALLRKDLLGLFWFLIAGTVVMTIALTTQSFVYTWALPPYRLEGPFHVAWIGGAILGLFLAHHDELLGTRDFLRHRPVAPRAFHTARLMAAALVLLTWAVLPPLLNWLLEAVFGQNVGLLRVENLADYWAAFVPACTACAIGLWAGTLPAGPVLRLLAGAAALLASFHFLDGVSQPANGADGWVWSMPVFVSGHLAVAALFAAVSFAGAETTADPDRPWRMASRSFGAGLGTLALAFCLATFVGEIQRSHWEGLWSAYPHVVAVDGKYQLAVRHRVDGRTEYLPTDAAHAVVGPALDRLSDHALYSAPFLRGGDPGFEPPRFRSIRTAYRFRSILLYGSGRVFVKRDRSWTGKVDLDETGKGPEHAPFAPDARLLDLPSRGASRFEGDAGSSWIVEVAEQRVWRFDEELGHFVEVALPAGDRLVAVQRVRPESRPDQSRIEVDELVYRLDSEEQDVLAGEHGVYHVRGDDLVPAPEWMQQQARPGTPARRTDLVDADPLAPTVRVLAADGHELFAHAYAPRTFAECFQAGALLFWSTTRPPLVQAWTHVAAAPGAQRDPLLDPLLAGGRRTWLLLLGLAMAAACAYGGDRRLRRLGAGVPARRFWAAATLLLGPAALLAGCVIERTRAYAPAPAGDRPAAGLRIAAVPVA